MRKLSAKIFAGLVFGMLGVFTLLWVTSAQSAAGAGWFGNQDTTYNPNVIGSTTGLAGDKLITTIKTAINWALGMLALIALVVLLFWGFQMITAAGDDGKYKKGFTILKQAGIGLVFIGVSWLIVSVIFFLLNLFTT